MGDLNLSEGWLAEWDGGSLGEQEEGRKVELELVCKIKRIDIFKSCFFSNDRE